jgi:hypothetical protein
MARELEPWGGEVHVPRWLRRLLRRPPEAEDTPERRQEPRRADDTTSVLHNANRAAAGPMADLYNEGRDMRGRGTTGKRGD